MDVQTWLLSSRVEIHRFQWVTTTVPSRKPRHQSQLRVYQAQSDSSFAFPPTQGGLVTAALLETNPSHALRFTGTIGGVDGSEPSASIESSPSAKSANSASDTSSAIERRVGEDAADEADNAIVQVERQILGRSIEIVAEH